MHIDWVLMRRSLNNTRTASQRCSLVPFRSAPFHFVPFRSGRPTRNTSEAPSLPYGILPKDTHTRLRAVISKQSRCAKFNQAVQSRLITSRLQSRYQAVQGCGRVAEHAQHATQISWLPGFNRRRRTGREWWCFVWCIGSIRRFFAR